MIFPDTTTQEWLIKHKSLKISRCRCDYCGKTMASTIPVITKSTVGLISPKCSCGKNKNGCMNFILRTNLSKNEWLNSVVID